MAIKTVKTESVFGGWQATDNFGGEGQFRRSIAIDPYMPESDSDKYPSGVIRPTAMAKFSASEITGVPLWIVTNPKNTNAYVYANDGKVHTIASDLTMGTALNSGTALTASSGNGAEYYDNYLYLAKNADVARYGPLNGTPSLTQDYWSNTLGLTSLTDTTYPSINGVEMPNHVMYRYTKDKLYITDVNDNKGILNYIKTTKTSVEGDTDDSSTYEALDFDYGVYPTAIEGYGTNLAIALIEGVDTTTKQKSAKLSFWDTTSASYNKITDVEFPDPLITALKNVNGRLYVFSGYASGGCRISVFAGGYSFSEVAWIPDIYPPLQGAVDHLLERVVMGSNTTVPEASASVFAIGSPDRRVPMGLHNILRANATGANPWVTALKYTQQDGNLDQPIVGYDDDTEKGLSKLSTTYGDYNVFQDTTYRFGREFKLRELRLPLSVAISTNTSFIVKFIDDTGATTLATINNTNNAGQRNIKLNPEATFYNKGYLQIEWTGTALCPISLPIEYEFEVLE